ncbi:MAG: choice-of-anchor Q domain-containing protein [Candidatus Cloacimonadota bacterium]|nr:choice-of-anchor Q domain-containing protein [Candidatus Cloacimonadota bacterium]
MKKIIILSKLLLIAIILFSFSLAIAEIINVPNDQPTIQDGIDIADNCDTVLVQPGTYVENINYNGKNITVGSLFLTTQDTIYISQTIIDGNEDGHVVEFSGGEDSTAILAGFIITNGFALRGGGILCILSSSPSLTNVAIIENTAVQHGGGIYCICSSSPSLNNVIIGGNTAVNGNGGGVFCWDNSNPILGDVTISGNTADWYGSGFYCSESNPILIDVTIIGNAGYSGGICCFSNSNLSLTNVTIIGNAGLYGGGVICDNNSSPSFTNVTISENAAEYDGGGIFCWDNSSPILSNVTISKNTAEYDGGGIYCRDSSPMLTNVTVSGNTAYYGGGLYCVNSSPSLVNCILWNDTPQEIYVYSGNVFSTYSDIQGGWTGEGNIDADPLFADPENGDFHLTWANFPIQDSTMSPCIDAGNPDTTGLNLPPFDLDGNPRIVNEIIDMGAYEWQKQVGVDGFDESSIATGLFQNYPNPFSTSTTISFNLATRLHKFPPLDSKHLTGQARIKIYNVKGQLIKQLFPIAIGINNKSSIEWDGKDENGNPLSSGIYFYKLEVGDKIIDIKKCLLLK